MDNQFSVLILRMEYLVATSPYSKIVVLRSLYYRFQIGIGRSTSCIRQWSTLDSMFDLFQVLGSNVFAGIWNGLRFEIFICPQSMLTKTQSMWSHSISVCVAMARLTSFYVQIIPTLTAGG